MALLQRTRVLANQRLDLQDYNNLENFIAADFNALHKFNWASQNYVMRGFIASGVGTNTLTTPLAGSSALFGADNGLVYIGAPSLSPLQTSSLTPGVRNYVELVVNQDSGGADSRAFWDQTAGGGAGGEFSQIVDTYIFTAASYASNASNFTGAADRIPLCFVDVNSSGIITKISDQRPLFFRLGRNTNAQYNFNWTNGRNAEDPANPSYQDPDKHISSLKDMLDALMDSIREIKGTAYWYMPPATSLVTTFQNTAMSVLTGATASARFTWTGSNLQITDGNVTPSPSDTIAFLRLFNSSFNLQLKRQNIPMTDGDVLWIEIPKPLTAANYSGVGASTFNYRISPRGSLPLDEDIYWVAYCEGTRVYLRNNGELDIGESQQINDQYSTALQMFLGFNPENATSVPYTFVPNSTYFGNTFNSSSTLVTAISVNTANINAIGAMLDENAYEETYEVVAGPASGNFEIVGPITNPTIITLPLDSRDALGAQEYLVGDGVLSLYLDGVMMIRGKDWLEIGTAGSLSSTVNILRLINIGSSITFRMASLGGFNVGAAGGGGDILGAQNLGGGEGELYISKQSGDLLLRTLKAGAGISITMSGDQIIISLTGGAPTPFARTMITGQNNALIGTGLPYNMGTDKLDAYRNGQLLVNSVSLGAVSERYQEATNTSIALDNATSVAPTEVFSFVNYFENPAYKTMLTGQTGTVLTIPSYTQGNSALRVYRNGILMNASGYGAAADRYTETSSTTITLSQAASSGEVFTIVSGPVPVARIDRTGLSGSSITLASAYTVGSGKLLVFRNGVLMLNSSTLGSSVDRYSEASSNSIALATAAVTSEVFTFIIVS